jgi:uncharacterized protein (DUF302 family)
MATESAVSYQATKLTLETGQAYETFLERFEQAVPAFPLERLAPLAAHSAPWQEVLDLTSAAAPHDFLVYSKLDAGQVMSLAGHSTRTAAYLVGNHTIAERMFRHDPSAMLHAPLRAVLWAGADGLARLAFDLPSAQFACFGNPEIAAVGVELDRKIAALLEHLDVAVPRALLTS